jgi:hypothetical protein
LPTFGSTNAPDTQVGAQLTWFLGARSVAPLSQQVIDAHFDSIFPGEVSDRWQEQAASSL